MISIFKKKSPISVLQKEYKKLMKEAYELSTSNRTLSDEKIAEAETILLKMKELEMSQKN
ncbi:MAG: Lacal_2735 family protein [Crocinitomicaceae bacterium]|nr:Lacal_2735 family protein [Crocinitomicaceae bacterium]